MDRDIGEMQFGFRDGVRTRKASFSLKKLAQRYLDGNKNMVACLADHVKNSEEVAYALKNMENRKIVISEEIPVELLKLVNEGHTGIFKELFNIIHITIIPRDWLISTFTVKQTNTRKRRDHKNHQSNESPPWREI